MQYSSVINILIASEFVIFRRGMKLMIENIREFSIIDEANNVNDIFSILQKRIPQIIILNLSLEPESLNSLCANIQSKHPKIPILLFIEESMKISLAELIVNGVRGVIWKDNSNDDLLEIIRCVAKGNLYFEDPDNCKVNCHLSNKTCNDIKYIVLSPNLTNRENEILRLISAGLSYKQIADQLFISSRTVESHKYNILTKLNLKNKNELIRFAIDNYRM
jgi:DNA-binding NarL/FixJ family response regulator